MNKIKYLFLALVAALSVVACNDPWKEINEGGWNHEHSIIAIEFEGQAGLTEITNTDAATGTVAFKLLTSNVPDMSKVAVKTLTLSYGATATVEKGETIDFTGTAPTIAVSSPNGDTRVYTLNMEEFTENLIGMYKIQNHMHYGGTGPGYGGAAVMDPQSKSWLWNQSGFGPQAEYDNYFEITFETVNAAGNSVGKCVHYAGVDGKFWNAIFLAKYNKEGLTDIDLHKFYRLLPMGTSTWERNYAEGTITFTDAAGKKTVATLMEAGEHQLYDGKHADTGAIVDGYIKKIAVPNLAFNFALEGTDDWTNIYGDYDKFAKKVRNHFVLFEPVESIPAESKTEGTEGDVTIAPPPAPVQLATPQITLGAPKATEVSFSWKAVENATKYEYKLDDGEVSEISELTTTITGLTPETVYTISLRAIGDGTLYLDSDWTSVSFTTPAPAVDVETIEGTYKINKRYVLTGNKSGSVSFFDYREKGQYRFYNSNDKRTESDDRVDNDNILKLSGASVSGTVETGTAEYLPGADGKYWDCKGYTWNTAGGSDRKELKLIDASLSYSTIPQGTSTYSYDTATGIITFTQGETVVSANFKSVGTHDMTYNGKTASSKLTINSGFGLDFVKGPFTNEQYGNVFNSQELGSDNTYMVYLNVYDYVLTFSEQ